MLTAILAFLLVSRVLRALIRVKELRLTRLQRLPQSRQRQGFAQPVTQGSAAHSATVLVDDHR